MRLFTGTHVLGFALATSVVAAPDQQPLTGPHISTGSTSGTGTVLHDDLRTRIGVTLREQNVTGYSIGVLRLAHSSSNPGRGEVLEFAQWGNRTESGDPITQDTIIGIGSMSKAFASAALGLVIDDFKKGSNVTSLPDQLQELTWDTKMKDILPEWELADKWASEKASIRDVLSHVTGMPRHDAALFRNETALIAVKRLRHLRSAFELRQEWHYNNFGYAVAQALVERYSQESLHDFIERRILDPLNMSSTSFSHERAEQTGRSSQAFDHAYRRVPHTFNEVDIPLVAGMGGVLSTAPDILRWARLFLGGLDERKGEAIIPRKVLEECMAAQALLPQQWQVKFGHSRVTYGFGWFQDEVAGVRRVYHGGSVTGVSSLLTLLPDHGAAIIQLANSDDKFLTNQDVVEDIIAAIPSVPSNYKPMPLVPIPSNYAAHRAAVPVVATSAAHQVDVRLFAGEYSDAGYGNYVFCSPPTGNALRSSSDDQCRRLHSAYSSVENVAALSKTKLYGYQRPVTFGEGFLTLALLPDDEDLSTPNVPEKTVTFELQYTQVFPKGYGADTRPFEYGASPGAGPRTVFSVDNGYVRGFGIFGFAGQVLAREKWGQTVEERAEVWFDNVSKQ